MDRIFATQTSERDHGSDSFAWIFFKLPRGVKSSAKRTGAFAARGRFPFVAWTVGQFFTAALTVDFRSASAARSVATAKRRPVITGSVIFMMFNGIGCQQDSASRLSCFWCTQRLDRRDACPTTPGFMKRMVGFKVCRMASMDNTREHRIQHS